jgi:hypothetical protein
MPFPPHIETVLNQWAIRADTKAALYDLYLSLGAQVLEVFADLAEGVASPSLLAPEDTVAIRERVVERYVRLHHAQWIAGAPTPSLWHPRAAEGRASGMAVPLGELPETARRVVPDDQPVPDGVLILGRNAHYGGRPETISFDVVASDLEDAVAIGKAEGQQHTMPGSVGQTSGTFDPVQNVALIWEVQPNVFKPAGERNRAIAKVYRKHRMWHLVTLAAAVDWLRAQKAALFILRGSALAVTHEVNREKPVADAIVTLHDRTVETVAASLDLMLRAATDADELELLETTVMNHALRQHVLRQGATESILRVEG